MAMDEGGMEKVGGRGVTLEGPDASERPLLPYPLSATSEEAFSGEGSTQSKA